MGENLVGYESSAESTVKETLESTDYQNIIVVITVGHRVVL